MLKSTVLYIHSLPLQQSNNPSIIYSGVSIFQCFKCSELCAQCCNFHQTQHVFLNTGNYSYNYFIYALTICCTFSAFIFFLTKFAKLCFFQYKINTCHPHIQGYFSSNRIFVCISFFIHHHQLLEDRLPARAN